MQGFNLGLFNDNNTKMTTFQFYIGSFATERSFLSLKSVYC